MQKGEKRNEANIQSKNKEKKAQIEKTKPKEESEKTNQQHIRSTSTQISCMIQYSFIIYYCCY
jgi:hypothetical protein